MVPLPRLPACFLALLLAACVPAVSEIPNVAVEEVRPVAGEDLLGIRVTSVRSSANGYFLDFRCRVLDPEKSRPLFDRSLKPYLIDEATGAKFLIPSPPKIGPLRQTTSDPEAGRIYFILFANPGKYVKAGSRVSVQIGDHRLEHLVVE